MIEAPHVELVSKTFSQNRFQEMVRAGALRVHEGHYLYPADEKGNHLTRFYSTEPLSRNLNFVRWVAEDISRWAKEKEILADILFAPADPSIATLTKAVGEALNISVTLWKYLPTGRFGELTGDASADFIQGRIAPGTRVIVFNGVTQQGRCVGEKLQNFAKKYGGEIVGLAVFAKGATDLVAKVEKEWGEKFYAAVRVQIPAYPPHQCPLEGQSDAPKLIPWTNLKLD